MSIKIDLGTSDSIIAKMSAAAATTNPTFNSAWIDSTADTPGGDKGSLNGTSEVTLVAAPAADQRQVDTIRIYNEDTASVTVTVQVANGANRYTLGKWTIDSGGFVDVLMESQEGAGSGGGSASQVTYTTEGTAPVYTLTPTPALTAYTEGDKFRIKIHATGTTGSNTCAVSGLAALNIKQYTPDGTKVPGATVIGQLILAEYDGTDLVILNPLPIINVPVRHTVYNGPLSATGLPSFLPSTSVNLNLTTSNISASAPLCVTSSLGYAYESAQVNLFGKTTSNLTWTGLTAANTNFLFVTVGLDGTLTTGFTVLAPVIQWYGTPSTTDKQYTYNIAERKMYVGNGATASVVNVVFVGEAVTGATTVLTTIAYAYNGFYEGAWETPLPGTNQETTFECNMGTTEYHATIEYKCISTEYSWAVGDICDRPGASVASGVTYPIIPARSRNACSFHTGTVIASVIVRRDTGGGGAPTAAKWEYRMTCQRNF